jgi:uncharacterized protein (DUF58 family)
VIQANLNQSVRGVYSSTQDLLRLRHLVQDLTLTTQRNSSALMNGPQRTHFRGRGMEFAEVRPYQPGDDIRTIDWRVTARTQAPHTKLFQEERERPVYVMVDLRAPMFFGSRVQFKSVFATELAAIIGWIAQTNNDRIGGLLFNDQQQNDIRAKRGKHAVLQLLHQLLTYNHALNSPLPPPHSLRLEDMLTDLRRVAKPGSAVFILSDFHDFNPDCRKPLTSLAKHCDLALVHIYDPLERQLPKKGVLSVTNGRQKRLLDTGSKKLQHEFSEHFNRLLTELRTACVDAAVPLIDAPVNQSAEQLALTLFNPRHPGARHRTSTARHSTSTKRRAR